VVRRLKGGGRPFVGSSQGGFLGESRLNCKQHRLAWSGFGRPAMVAAGDVEVARSLKKCRRFNRVTENIVK